MRKGQAKAAEPRRFVLRVTLAGGQTDRYAYVAVSSDEAVVEAKRDYPTWVAVEWLPRGTLAAVWCCERCDYTFARMERPKPACPNCESRERVYIQWGNIAVQERAGQRSAEEIEAARAEGSVGF